MIAGAHVARPRVDVAGLKDVSTGGRILYEDGGGSYETS
jgi:hypothetical protein